MSTRTRLLHPIAPIALAFVLFGGTAFGSPGEIAIKLDGSAQLVVERMVVRSGTATTYKSPGGTARINGTITIENGLALPVKSLKVRVQLRTATGAAPSVGVRQVQAPPQTWVDYKLKQPLEPGASTTLPLKAELFVMFEGGGSFMTSDEQLKQARTISLDVDEAGLGSREIELQPAPAPPPPPAEYEGYANRLDRQLTATLARPTRLTAALIARPAEEYIFKRDAAAPIDRGPLGYRLLVKGEIPVLAKNTGPTALRSVVVYIEDRIWIGSLGSSPTVPDPSIDPGEERALAVKLDHVIRLPSAEVPSTLPLPLVGRSSYRALDPSPVKLQADGAITEVATADGASLAALHAGDEVIEIGRPRDGFAHVRRGDVTGFLPETALRAAYLRGGKDLPLKHGARLATDGGYYLPACEIAPLGVKLQGRTKGSFELTLRRGGSALAFQPGVKEGRAGTRQVILAPVAYGDPACPFVHTATLANLLGVKP